MKKKILSLIMAAAMLLSIQIPMAVSAQSVSVWDGTEDTSWYYGHEDDDVYYINSARQLRGLESVVDRYSGGAIGYDFEGKTIYLTTDIDLAGDDGKVWRTIGYNKPFKGTLDGQGHVIKNIYVTKDVGGGLFFQMAGAVQNLGIENFKNVGGTGYYYTGVLARRLGQSGNRGATVKNVYIKGADISADDNASYVKIGALSGDAQYSVDIENVYINGVNVIYGGNSISVAGLIGEFGSKAANSSIKNCYVANFKGRKANAYANGFSSADVTLENVFAAADTYTEVNGWPSGVNDVGVIQSSVLKTKAADLGDGFKEDIFNANDGYPILAWEPIYIKGEEETADVWDGNDDTSWYYGHEDDDVYYINSARQLRGLESVVDRYSGGAIGYDFEGKTIYLTTDIDLAGDAGKVWRTIGYNKPFKGTLDGQGHIIKNIYVTRDGGGGLFCQMAGTVKNLGIEDFKTSVGSGYFYSGVLARRLGVNEGAGATLQNVYVKNSEINYSASSGYFKVGGIAGDAYSDIVMENVYVNGLMINYENTGSAGISAGALIGEQTNGTESLTSCYTANIKGVEAKTYVSSGIGESNTTTENLYAATDTYYKADGWPSYINGVGSINSNTLKTKAADLGSGFKEDALNINDGYPILSWQKDGTIPDAPVIQSASTAEVIVTPMSNVQYGIVSTSGGNVLWQNSNVFTGLGAGDYYVFVRTSKTTDSSYATKISVEEGYVLSNIATNGRRVTATLSNNLSEVTTAVAIVAVYDAAGRLINVYAQPIEDLAPKTDSDIAISIETPAETDIVRLFVWDSLNGMTPLTDKANIWN